MSDQTFQDQTSPPRQRARFLRDDDGAVTVDWVVLTAAIVGLGIAVGFSATATLPDLANSIDTFLRAQTVVPN